MNFFIVLFRLNKLVQPIKFSRMDKNILDVLGDIYMKLDLVSKNFASLTKRVDAIATKVSTLESFRRQDAKKNLKEFSNLKKTERRESKKMEILEHSGEEQQHYLQKLSDEFLLTNQFNFICEKTPVVTRWVAVFNINGYLFAVDNRGVIYNKHHDSVQAIDYKTNKVHLLNTREDWYDKIPRAKPLTFAQATALNTKLKDNYTVVTDGYYARRIHASTYCKVTSYVETTLMEIIRSSIK